ncbi:MAG: AsmA family protein [Desulfobacteraceae bacterium]|nr:AsmA family protein [Desulfobacteraceae bacterium]
MVSLPAILFAVLYFGITIPLGFLEGRLELLAGRLLDREVVIEEPVRLKISFHPMIRFGGISIGNPAGWETEDRFLTADQGQGQIDLLSLLQGDLRIENLELKGVDLLLVTRSDQTVNYRFAIARRKTDTGTGSHEFAKLDNVHLRDLRVRYRDELTNKEYEITVSNARGQGAAGLPLYFSAEGTFGGHPYSLEVEGGSLSELIKGENPWLLKNGKLVFSDVVVDVSGTVIRSSDGGSTTIDIALSGKSLKAIGNIAGFTMPEFGEFSLAARIGIRSGMFTATRIEMDAGNASLTGDLVLALHRDRPSLSGNITVPVLDSAFFSKLKGDHSDPNHTGNSYGSAEDRLPWEVLQSVDTDLHLIVKKISADPFQLKNLKATASLVDGDLMLPFSVTAVEASVDGRMDVLTDPETPELHMRIYSAGTQMEPLLKAVAPKLQYSGRIGSISLEGNTRGKSLGELAEGFNLSLKVGPTQLSTESGPIFAADGLTLERRAGRYFTLSAGGDFMSRPFKLEVSKGNADKDPNDPAGPLRIRLDACDAKLQLDAAPTPNQPGRNAAFQFSVEGTGGCGLLDPVAKFMNQAADFSVSGEGSLGPESCFLELGKIRLGNIVADGTAELKADSQGEPLILATTHMDKFDLGSFLAERKRRAEDGGAKGTGSVETPVNGNEQDGDGAIRIVEQQRQLFKRLLTMDLLPQKRLLATDADLRFVLDQLETGRGRIENVQFTAHIKDGKLTRSPFQAEIADKLFKGDAKMDLTGEIPAVQLDLVSERLNLPELFHAFQLGRSPNITADHVRLQFDLKGKNVQEWALQSSQKILIQGGRWIIGRKVLEPLQIDIERVSYSSTPEEPARIALSGAVNSEPLSLELFEDGLLARSTGEPFQVQFKAGLADARLSIDGKRIRRSQNNKEFLLHTVLSGHRMDSLNRLLGFNLPPFGPYRIEGTLENRGDAIHLPDLTVKIGETSLNGEIALSGTRKENGSLAFPLHLETRLKADSIQLDDFQLVDWSPLKQQEKAGTASVPGETSTGSEPAARAVSRLKDLLSPELAALIEGSLHVEVGKVLSGKDKLGGGKLSVRLENDRYSLEDLHLDIPGGSIRIQGALRPAADHLEAQLAMQVEQLDYGILLRRASPDSNAKGKLNFNLDLRSTAGNPSQLKEHLSGHLGIGVVPEGLSADAIDLWVVNILTRVLPALLKGSPSQVNCIAAKFTVDDGIVHPDVFLLDTTKMRVQGKGGINLKTDVIDFHMKPMPKSAQFFSLATPISITGSIGDAHIKVSAGGVLTTFFRAATSAITVPFQWLFSQSMAPDGQEACSKAMDWVKEQNPFYKQLPK